MSSRKRFFEDRVVSLYSVKRGHRSYLRRREFFMFTPLSCLEKLRSSRQKKLRSRRSRGP